MKDKIIEILNRYVDFSVYSAEKNILNAITDEILTLPLYEKEFITWLFSSGNVWTDCTGLEPIPQIEIDDKVYSIEDAYKYWQNLPK